MIISIMILAVLALLLGLVLGISAIFLKNNDNTLADEIEAILPQTQCGQCNYPGCRPYAEAIAKGEASINQCPPGGQDGIDALANLLAVETMELNAENGEEKPKGIAFIREAECIGCTLCIQACPVDAILGASKTMTTVIAIECTGCELCIPVCPVDCIDMVVATVDIDNYVPQKQAI